MGCEQKLMSFIRPALSAIELLETIHRRTATTHPTRHSSGCRGAAPNPKSHLPTPKHAPKITVRQRCQSRRNPTSPLTLRRILTPPNRCAPQRSRRASAVQRTHHIASKLMAAEGLGVLHTNGCAHALELSVTREFHEDLGDV